MKIYGSKAHRVGKEHLDGMQCAYCHEKDTVDLFIFYRYRHFAGIPILPHRRGGAIMCSNCKHVTHSKQFTADVYEIYLEKKKKYKAPLWQYAGSVTAGVLIFSFILVKLLTYQAVTLNKFMKGIKEKNIYRYSLSPTRYTYWKINRVVQDSIFILPSNYEFKGAKPANLDYNKPDFFDTKEKLYLKSEFQIEFEEKKLKRVK